MRVILHREKIEMGEGADGPRQILVWTIQLVTTELVEKGRLKVEQEKDPLDLPYIIWPASEHGRTRFRWARRHRGKPEMRLGIATHGARESLEDAIVACLDNHHERRLLSSKETAMSETTETSENTTPKPSQKPAPRFVYSLDGSEFRGHGKNEGWESRDEALAAGREQAAQIARLKDQEPGSVWTGLQVHYSASAFFPEASVLIEYMADSADGEVGSEATDDWPDVTDEAEAELVAFVTEKMWPFLESWAEKHKLEPTFYGVTEVVKHADDDGAIATP